MKSLRVLIISRTPWNDSNSFGNTFSNLFEGMRDVEVYSICCQDGDICNSVVTRTLQMSEFSVIRSIFGGDVRISHLSGPTTINQISINAKNKKSTLLLFARDLIWAVGARKWKKAIRAFITEVHPHILYLPVYASLYMCQIDRFAMKCARVPVVGHISDDIWNYSPADSCFSLKRLNKWLLRKKEYRLINNTSYLEVFARNMKIEYEDIFSKPCYLIGKGVSIASVSHPKYTQYENRTIHFVYTGGIGGERYQVLLDLGRSLDRQPDKDCVLDIYTFSSLTTEMRAQMEYVNSIRLHDAVLGDEVRRIQNTADVLVHVEGFSAFSIFSARMSFSTKIIDYLSTGNVLLAIGPPEINSIQVLRASNSAIVVDDINKIDIIVSDLLSGKINVASIQDNAYLYLTTERLKSTIQEGILGRMNNLIMTSDGV